MTADAHRRRAIAVVIVLLVVLALAVPFSLVTWARSSSANFADSEEVGVNRLGAATLDIEVGPATTSFQAANMAPGDVSIGTLELVNAGSLPLRYALTANRTDGLLAQWLLFDVWISSDCETAVPASNPLVVGLLLDSSTPLIGDPTTGSQPGDRIVAPLEAETVCLAARLPLAAPNSVQGASLTIDLVIDAEHNLEVE